MIRKMPLAAFLAMTLSAGASQDGQDKPQEGKHFKFCCPRTWYTSETCTCNPKGGRCSDCKCGGCVGGDKCPCTEALKKGTGVLTGRVAHRSAQKFPTVVYIDEMPGQYQPPGWMTHIDQKNKEFTPHVIPLLVGSTVEFLNSDSFEHNVMSPDNERFNLGNWGQNEKRTYTFSHPGVYTLLCSIHPEMTGYAVVLKTPYFAVANEKGEFRIANVPPGTWKVKIWNERLKEKQLNETFEVTVELGKEAKLEIKP